MDRIPDLHSATSSSRFRMDEVEASLFEWQSEELSDHSDEAADKIRNAFLQGNRTLDLRGHELHSLPRAVGYLTDLERLYLSHNNLRSIPIEIPTHLTKLTELFLSDNKLLSLPVQISNLTLLQILDLGRNPDLNHLPLGLANIPDLYLDLWNTAIPPEQQQAIQDAQTARLAEQKFGDLSECLAVVQTYSQGVHGVSSLFESLNGYEKVAYAYWMLHLGTDQNFEENQKKVFDQLLQRTTRQSVKSARKIA